MGHGSGVRISGNGTWGGDFWRFRVGGTEKCKLAFMFSDASTAGDEMQSKSEPFVTLNERV